MLESLPPVVAIIVVVLVFYLGLLTLLMPVYISRISEDLRKLKKIIEDQVNKHPPV